MRAPVSVVIPTLNAEGGLPACLSALFEGVQAGLIRELVIVDGGSEDTTQEIAQEAGATLVETSPSRGGQLGAGARASEGEWLLFVHADTVLSEGWSAAVEPVLSNPDRAHYFKLRFDQGGVPARIVAGWANLRARLFGVPYGDQGLLVSRVVYNANGGYPDIPLMEDVAIARALKGRLRVLPATAVTSSAKYRKQGWLRRGARNLTTLTRYLLGASPESLAQSYRR
ncbi:TIGR04283 family arsenosugar biosynthesis glycosyltransferase [Shimia sp. SDUM112013]|uniref:TIGR04283 family arsenosugar biosynthesis glycosyltransferase n=1 Tax=Shimia sp. SDUM112013 TaxID=3136160 RepID=UPI0032ED1ED4